MAYFSNGTEFQIYEERYCSRCIHQPINPDDGGCPIVGMLFFHNHEPPVAAALEMVIPRTKDGLDNEQCKMFTGRIGESPDCPACGASLTSRLRCPSCVRDYELTELSTAAQPQE